MVRMAETESTFARWTFSHYFQFIKEKDKNIIVKCNLCVCATPRELSTSKNSTSNLKKHLDRCHGNTKLTERAGAEKRKNDGDESKTKQQK